MADFINPKNAKLMMIIAMSIFGSIGVITHYVDMPSSVIVLFRGVVGTAFILLILKVTGSRINKEDVMGNMFTLICSGVCLGLNWLFLFEAYKSIEISVATVCNYLTPALVILVSPIFLREKLTLTKLGCALLALFGLVVVSGIFETGSVESLNLYGIGCGVMAAVFYTGLVIFNKKLRSIGSFDKTVSQLGIASVLVLIYCLATVDFGYLVFDGTSIVLMVILGIVQTAIAFTLYFGSLTYLDAQNAVIYGYLEPIIGLFLAAVIIGENLGPIGWCGAALVLGSTLISEIVEWHQLRKRVEKLS